MDKDLPTSNDQLSTGLKKYEEYSEESQSNKSRNSIPCWKIERSEVEKISQQYLGEGAWGIVYSGKFQGEKVAIKHAHRELLQVEDTVDMIKTEISIMAHLVHPNFSKSSWSSV